MWASFESIQRIFHFIYENNNFCMQITTNARYRYAIFISSNTNFMEYYSKCYNLLLMLKLFCVPNKLHTVASCHCNNVHTFFGHIRSANRKAFVFGKIT